MPGKLEMIQKFELSRLELLFCLGCCCCSVAKSCLTLCDPLDYSIGRLPVPHYLLEFAQVHVHWVGDATQPSHPLPLSYLFALNLSQHQGLFQWVSSLHQVTKELGLYLQHQSFQCVVIIWVKLSQILTEKHKSVLSSESKRGQLLPLGLLGQTFQERGNQPCRSLLLKPLSGLVETSQDRLLRSSDVTRGEWRLHVFSSPAMTASEAAGWDRKNLGQTCAKRSPNHSHACLEELWRLIHHWEVEMKPQLLISRRRVTLGEAPGVWRSPCHMGRVGCDLLACAQLSRLFVLWAVLGANQAQLLCMLIKIGACNYSAVTSLFLRDKSSLVYLPFSLQVYFKLPLMQVEWKYQWRWFFRLP